MSRMEKLLAAFLAILAVHGLQVDALDPWRGWLAFKEYARATWELPDEGVSVQVGLDGDQETHLYFLRQAAVLTADRLEPVGGVVCDLCYAAQSAPTPTPEYWSFDYATFDRFVDVVEQDPMIAALFLQRPLSSQVYWEEA